MSTPVQASDILIYEQKLAADARWALIEGSMHFEEKSAVFSALLKIAAKLDELEIPYAIAGGMALFLHGYRRFTEDVDILVTRDGLKRIHESLDGLGWVPPFAKSKNLRDTENGVRIEFLVSGEFPGDGKPKPVAFPEPGTVWVEKQGMRVLGLETLLELKLASGLTGAGRFKDLGDVQELMRLLSLQRNFGDRLDAMVQGKYFELWDDLHRDVDSAAQ
jgi:hypothetical protein